MIGSARAEVIRLRTYARPTPEGFLETWEQTVSRVMEHQAWLWERAKGASLTAEENAELGELCQLIWERKIFPSGRILWMGGTETIRRRESASLNCFGRETTFITSTGVKSFEDFEDGDTIEVFTHKGRWRPATVRYHGVQPLNSVRFARLRSSYTVRVTPDHTWILRNGERTNALRVGDTIARPASGFGDWDWDTASVFEQLYWCYGMVYGDGYARKDGTSTIRLCGDKKRFLPRFHALGFSSSAPLSCGGDPIVYVGTYAKTPPDLTKDTPNLTQAFVRGYLDADGYINCNRNRGKANSQFRSIQATGSNSIDFIRAAFPVAGVFISSEGNVPTETNYGTRSAPTVSFRIADTFGASSNSGFSVKEITEIEPDGVWCLDVEDDHSFTIPNGLVTGNCSFLRVQTVHDLVDAYWLTLQGCGVGFEPVPGILNGFPQPMEVVAVPSLNRERGREHSVETIDNGVWTISVGDSAEAWAKAVGKLVAGKPPRVRKLVLDFSEIRRAGSRLRGYGWLSSGDTTVRPAFLAIAALLNRRAGGLLSRIDILDIVNHLGTTLSSRRSAQIALVPYGDGEADAFIHAKQDCWKVGNQHRQMSNNSLLIEHAPSKAELYGLFAMMQNAGGSEPGFINVAAAKRRAPWYAGGNPCNEILLGNRSICNLTEVVVSAFDSTESRSRAVYLAARMNYRQTCIDLDDGILQRSWHELNQFLRLCGLGLTGLAGWTGMCAPALRSLRAQAHNGAHDMAIQLGLPYAKAITTCKPSGTLSKVADCSEGIHTPMAQYLINNVSFSRHDPLLERLEVAGYRVFDHPTQADARLVSFPVEYTSECFTHVDGSWLNMETAIDQLKRYKLLMDNYVDHNASMTVSYTPDEIPDMVDWLHLNWDSYVGTAFLPRVDPTKTAKDYGYAYLPQEACTDKAYRDYVESLRPVDLDGLRPEMGPIPDAGECAGGACPVR